MYFLALRKHMDATCHRILARWVTFLFVIVAPMLLGRLTGSRGSPDPLVSKMAIDIYSTGYVFWAGTCCLWG